MDLLSVMVILILAFAVTNLVGFWYLNKKTVQPSASQQSLDLLSQWASEIRSGLDRQSDMIAHQLSTANETLHRRLDSTAQLLRLLNKDLGGVHEIGQQMRDFQHIFRAPQLRGKLGERMMNEILFQIMPHSMVKLQHRFSNGVLVDALLTLEQGTLCIDAKFPMENFHKAAQAPNSELSAAYQKEFYRDVRRHLETVRSKYIVPTEGTLDFALVYVPSEAIYYEILRHDRLLYEAEAQNILLVSPHTLYYVLRLILYGLYSQKLEQTAAEVLRHLNGLQAATAETIKELGILIGHLSNAKNSSERLQRRMEDLAGKIEGMTFLRKEEQQRQTAGP